MFSQLQPEQWLDICIKNNVQPASAKAMIKAMSAAAGNDGR